LWASCVDNVLTGSIDSDEFRSTSVDTPGWSSGRADSVVRSHCRLLRSLSQPCTTTSRQNHRQRVSTQPVALAKKTTTAAAAATMFVSIVYFSKLLHVRVSPKGELLRITAASFFTSRMPFLSPSQSTEMTEELPGVMHVVSAVTRDSHTRYHTSSLFTTLCCPKF